MLQSGEAMSWKDLQYRCAVSMHPEVGPLVMTPVSLLQLHHSVPDLCTCSCYNGCHCYLCSDNNFVFGARHDSKMFQIQKRLGCKCIKTPVFFHDQEMYSSQSARALGA